MVPPWTVTAVIFIIITVGFCIAVFKREWFWSCWFTCIHKMIFKQIEENYIRIYTYVYRREIEEHIRSVWIEKQKCKLKVASRSAL